MNMMPKRITRRTKRKMAEQNASFNAERTGRSSDEGELNIRKESVSQTSPVHNEQRQNTSFQRINPELDNDELIMDNDDEWWNQHPAYVIQIIELIKNAGVSQKKIPADGDCCVHSIVASLQINSSRYDLSAENLMSKLNLRLGSNYWWTIEEMCSLVESIGYGLFAVQNENGKNTLNYFNAQRVLKRNIFVALKSNHYYVIDLKLKNHIDFDLICEIS